MSNQRFSGNEVQMSTDMNTGTIASSRQRSQTGSLTRSGLNRARRCLVAAAAIVASLCITSPILAQCTEAWSQPSLLAARGGHGMAYDSDRQRVVMFGGNSHESDLNTTWEWD